MIGFISLNIHKGASGFSTSLSAWSGLVLLVVEMESFMGWEIIERCPLLDCCLSGLIGRGSFAPVCKHQQADAHHDDNGASDGPLDLAGHYATGKDVDALQEPYTTCKDE